MIDYLITGGSGFIGTNLRRYLESKGLTDPENFINVDWNPHNAHSIEHDVCEGLPPTKAKHIVHLAATTDVRYSARYPLRSFIDNCHGVANCLELARESGASSFVFASSVGASEACSPSGASKLAGEALCRAYRESYGLNVRILRLANVYGPYSSHKTSVVAKFIKQIIKKEPLQVFGTGIQTRDFVFVSDVVKSITSFSNVINQDLLVATGRQTSILTLIDMLSGLANHYMRYRPKVEFLSANEGEVLHSSPLSNIDAEVSLEEGLDKTFKWFLKDRDKSSGFAV